MDLRSVSDRLFRSGKTTSRRARRGTSLRSSGRSSGGRGRAARSTGSRRSKPSTRRRARAASSSRWVFWKKRSTGPTRAKKIVDVKKVVGRGRPLSLRASSSSGKPVRRPGQGVARSRAASQRGRRSSRASKHRRWHPWIVFRALPWKRTLVGSALAIGIMAALYVGVISSFFRVERVVLRGDVSLTPSQLQAAVQPLLDERFLGIPLNSVFVLSEGRLLEAIQASHPRISDVKLVRKYPNVLVAELTEVSLGAVWVSGEQIALLDEEARVCCFVSPEALVQMNDVPQFVDLSVRALESGTTASETRHLEAAQRVQQELPQRLSLSVRRFELPGAKGPELHVVTREEVRVYLSLDHPMEDQLNTLETVFREELRERYASLEYIDLRVPGHVYYQ